MKPKDPIWNFYEVTEEGSKKITKCRECGTVVSAKSDRLKIRLTVQGNLNPNDNSDHLVF
jgi:uncharacterized Zn finger protein